MNFNLSDIVAISPLIWLFLASVIPITVKAFNNGKEMNPFTALMWSVIGLMGAAALTLSAVNSFWKISEYNFVEAFNQAIIIDGITVWASYIIYVVVGFCLFLVYDSHATRDRQFSEHLFLILNATIGMALAVMSNNLIVTFMAIELMSLSTYLLIALNKEKLLSKEASFKYFVLGSVSSAIFLYGIAFLYGGVGSTSLHEIGELAAQLYQANALFRFGVILTIIGFAFKVSLVPFHSWTPDVYQGSATPVTSVMATAVKVASFIAFLRFFLYADFYDINGESFISFIQWLAALTMIVGNVAALKQESFKRMLAYSSVAHSGYAFMAVIASTFGRDSDAGIASLIFYLLSYTIMTVGTLALAVLLEKSEKSVVLIKDLRGLGTRSPLVALSLSVLLFSLAGLPPSIGFFGKFYVFSAALEQGLIWLTFLAVISSVVSVYFYLKPIVYMYMHEGEGLEPREEAFFSQSIVYLTAIGVVVLGIFS
ncbi:MAG: NADH-quinone oxidoreductase subunit N, partial [Bdellovibrionales bacterium]|nr:NADH-quinone oxidoreductase subunit N [Bdellovibrionales bacterium]